MKELKHKICLIVVLGIIAFILIPFSYAEVVIDVVEKELGCAPGPDNPRGFEMLADPNTQYSVTTKGVRVDGGKEKEVFEKVFVDYTGDYSQKAILYRYALRKLDLMYPPVVKAKCSSDPDYTNMWPGGTTHACNKGDGIFVQLRAPVCKEYKDHHDNKEHAVFEVKITKDVEDEEMIRKRSSKYILAGLYFFCVELCWGPLFSPNPANL